MGTHSPIYPTNPSVVVVGAGMSGICIAIKLRAAGVHDVTILEKGSDYGGTWRDNTYPGLTCDVPATFYAYRFAPNPDWSHQFAPGGEIHAYLRGVAQSHGLTAVTRFGEEVVEGTYACDGWTLRTASGATYRADVVIAATGVLHRPAIPDLPGLGDFAGRVFHSAHWDHDLDVESARIAVIGSGSTGTQIVSALAGAAPRVLHFQRTPQWMVPMPNRRHSWLVRRLRRLWPALSAASYRANQATMDWFFTGLIVPGWRRRATALACRANLRRVRDPALRRRLTPDYDAGCKRLVMSWDYYDAVQRPDVELVDEAIERVEREGIRTADGRLHELDAIVLATGFDAHAYMRPMRLQGEHTTLDRAWRGGPRAYLSLAIPGFPNLFLLMGPHSPIGNTSLFPIAEAQADAIVRLVRRIADGEVLTVAAREEATAAFEREIAGSLDGTVWTTGCDSWYLADDGVPRLWPFPPRRFYAELRALPDEALVLNRGE